jgi:hypothetical protein
MRVSGTSKNSEFAQMQGAGKISPRRIWFICKQEIFSRNAAVGMKWGKQAIREADARKSGFLRFTNDQY